MKEQEKTNLTLRLSKEVVEKARGLGLNLSAITESFLKTESLMNDSEIITPEKMREAYRKVFLLILKPLKEWESFLQIGREVEYAHYEDQSGKRSTFEMEYSFYLNPDGSIDVCNDNGEELNSWKLSDPWPTRPLYDSEKLIENLIETLHNKAESNKLQLHKLSLLKNVLEKINGANIEEKRNKPETASKKGGIRLKKK